jgi:hypothetical protein
MSQHYSVFCIHSPAIQYQFPENSSGNFFAFYPYFILYNFKTSIPYQKFNSDWVSVNTISIISLCKNVAQLSKAGIMETKIESWATMRI